MIRKCTREDAYRIAEIMVFNNRINYYPIFNDPDFSFRICNVKDLGDSFLKDDSFLNNAYVDDDNGVIKGFVAVREDEIFKLYVEPAFQNQGVGQQLLDYAVNQLNAGHLWALEKNTKARRFYNRNGFTEDGQRCLEEGTDEYLVRMVLNKE